MKSKKDNLKFHELLRAFVQGEPRERTVGRYYASELGSLFGGYLTPESFFVPSPLKVRYYGNIVSGMAYEDIYEKILLAAKIEHVYNPKYELKITDDITLVVKPDFVFKDRVEETKYIFNGDWTKYKYQLEAEHRATGLPVYCVQFSSPFALEHHAYEPSDELWRDIRNTLISFDKAVRAVDKSLLTDKK